MHEKQSLRWYGICTAVDTKTRRRRRGKVADEYVMKACPVRRKEYITRSSRLIIVSQGDNAPDWIVKQEKKIRLTYFSMSDASTKVEQVRDLTAQAGNYAAEMMSSHIERSHADSRRRGRVCDNGLPLVSKRFARGCSLFLRFDREGPIECSRLNFIIDLARFLLRFFAEQRFENHHSGVNRDMDSKFGSAVKGVSVLLDTEQSKVKLGLHVDPKRLNGHSRLNGRATNALLAALANEEGLVVKIYWPGSLVHWNLISSRMQMDEGVREYLPEAVVHHTLEGTSTARIREHHGLSATR